MGNNDSLSNLRFVNRDSVSKNGDITSEKEDVILGLRDYLKIAECIIKFLDNKKREVIPYKLLYLDFAGTNGIVYYKNPNDPK